MRSNNFKRTLFVLVLIVGCFVFTACKRTKQIPNEKLTEIFKDMYLLNAYIDNTRLSMQLDSVDIYKPVLEKYGYTEADFKYTITESMKRKSFRLSEIVDKVIASLETDYAAIEEKVRWQARIDSLAYAISEENLYSKQEIAIRKAADTLPIDILIKKDKGAGRFLITYYYKLDSANFVEGMVNKHEILNAKGGVVGSSSFRPYPGKGIRYETTIIGSDDAVKLRLKFGGNQKNAKKINMTIDSLTVKRQLPLEKAMKALVEQYAGYKLMIGDKKYDEYISMPADSGALDILPPLAPQGADSLSGR